MPLWNVWPVNVAANCWQIILVDLVMIKPKKKEEKNENQNKTKQKHTPKEEVS